MEKSLLHSPRIWLKRLALAGLFVLLSLLLLVQALPFIAIQLGQYEYAKLGKGYELHVQDWQWSPWQTELKISKLLLLHPTDDQQGAQSSQLNTFEIVLRPWQLFSGQLFIENVIVSGLELAADVSNGLENQLKIVGLSIPLASAQTTSPQNADNHDLASGGIAPTQLSNENSETPMGIHIEKITIKQSLISWQQTLDESKNSGAVHISEFNVGPFDSQLESAMAIQGQLALNEFLFKSQAEHPAADSSNIQLEQPLAIKINGQLNTVHTQPAWQGDVFFTGLSITLPASHHFQFEHLNIMQLLVAIDPQGSPRIVLPELQLQNLQVSREQHELITLGQYQLTDLHWQPESLTSGPMIYENFKLDIERLGNGSVSGFAQSVSPSDSHKGADKPANLTAQQITAEKTEKDNQNKTRVQLAEFRQYGKPGKINVTDNSVQPAYVGALRINQFSVAPISIASSQTQIPWQVLAEFSLDDYNRFNVEATLTLHTQPNGEIYPQGNVALNIKQLDMVPFNGYLAKAMGYHLEKGMLQMQANVNIKNAQLKGEAKVLLRNAKFVPEDEKIIASLSKKIAMPVDLALDLLRDKNGNVNLAIPITGDLTNPDFGAGDISAQISQLVLQNAALHYLKMALQPYGLFLSLATYAGTELMAIRLDALNFDDFAFELSLQQQEQLTNIVAMMQKKPSLELQVCPFVNQQEVTSLGDQWPTLAVKRGATIKAYLADKTDLNGKVLAERITLCKPQKSEKSEVVLGFN